MDDRQPVNKSRQPHIKNGEGAQQAPGGSKKEKGELKSNQKARKAIPAPKEEVRE
jgi:hypothetical protein